MGAALDPDACIFARARLQFWDDEYPDAQRLIAAFGEGEFYGASDPSLGGEPGRGDYSATVVLAEPKGGKTRYVIVADLAPRTPDQTIEKILQYAQMYRFSNFGVEANQFQQLMVDDLKRRARDQGLSMTVTAIKNRSGKQQRIAALEADVTQGLIRFSRQHQLLLDQLRAFPVVKHDDKPDALEMAIHAASDDTNQWQICCMATGRVMYDSRWPQGVGFGKEDRMPDRL